jgi:hypothetical protein
MLRLIAMLSKAVMPRLAPVIAFDRWAAERADKSRAVPPIFIVGAPRSGTTVLFKSLAETFELTYPSNVESALFAAPWLLHQASWPFKRAPRSFSEQSRYGYVGGLWSPSEAGPLLRLLLDQKKRRLHFRDAVLAASSASGRPYLCKNTHNSLRVSALTELFPDALFIWCRRDRAATIRSILRMREVQEGNITSWSGVRPEGWQAVSDRSPEDQVAWQVDTIETQIAADAGRSGSDLLPVQHEDFAADRYIVLDAIAKHYSGACSGRTRPALRLANHRTSQ